MRISRWGCAGLTTGGLSLLACIGLALPLEVLLMVGLGWILYVYRTAQEVTVSPVGVVSAVVCLGLFAVGLHGFLRWFYREVRAPEIGRWRWKWTGALVAGILLMFTAGMAATGVVHQVGWLLTSRDNLVGSGAMQAARRAQSMNNLKQIGLGVINCRDANRSYPPGATMGDNGVLLHSWQALIGPYMELPRASDIDFHQPWDDPANLPIFKESVSQFLIPSKEYPTMDEAGLALSHYEGNARVIGGTRRLSEKDVTDGTSSTILAGEVAGRFQPWGKPGHWRDPADGINRSPTEGFGSPFVGGANVLMMDGTVRFLRNTVSPTVLKALSTPAGGENLSADAY